LNNGKNITGIQKVKIFFVPEAECAILIIDLNISATLAVMRTLGKVKAGVKARIVSESIMGLIGTIVGVQLTLAFSY